jgi:hypothetical protein
VTARARGARRAHLLALAAAAACLALAAGCSPVLVAQSSPPPGRSARLDEIRGFWGLKGYRMELSQGVALAVACYQGGPCEGLSVASDNPAIAEIRRASLGTLERRGIYGTAPAAAVVVVGKAPGTTQIRVRTKGGHRNFPVTVVPPPGPIATQATSAPPPAPPAVPAPAVPAPAVPAPAVPAPAPAAPPPRR